jgi:tRNA threonylcarbamoyladenosine biosynthesis protein TsaB
MTAARRVVALDASTWWGGLALVERGEAGDSTRTVAELGIQVRESHAGQLLVWAEWLLERAGWTRSDLDGFVATRGPGSFTGIRIGLGTVVGLSVAAAKPCVGISTLEALAEAHGPDEGPRIVLMEAGRGEAYGARFDASSSPPEPIEPPWLNSVDLLSRLCESGTVTILAPGSEAIADRLRETGAGTRVVAIPRTVASAAGRIALLRGFPGPDESGPPAPLYIRPPDALARRR